MLLQILAGQSQPKKIVYKLFSFSCLSKIHILKKQINIAYCFSFFFSLLFFLVDRYFSKWAIYFLPIFHYIYTLF